MSIRTTVTLDEDVLERVRAESRQRGASFRATLNELLRQAFATPPPRPMRSGFQVKPSHMGFRPALNYDSTESLLEIGEGEAHR